MTDTPLHETPLCAVHVASGAKMVPFGGWNMPVQYGPILEEIRTVRTKTGLFDLSHMGRVEVTGPDAGSLLNRVASNFCTKIPLHSIRYGVLCKEDGGAIDDVLVYRDGPDEFFVVVNASNTEVDLAWLRQHAEGLDVSIVDRTSEQAMIALQGPASQDALQKLVDIPLADIGYYKFAFGTLCSIEGVRISRTGYTGEDGFELYFPPTESERVWKALLEAGQPEGLTPIGLGARDTLRLEAGMPLYGHEIDAEHNPVEAGLHFGISFKEEKGDWIGRGALAAVKESPTRQLVGLTTAGKRVPREGYLLFHGDEQVGHICSGAVSPTLETNIGSAYLPPALATPGTRVEMDIRGKRQECVVVEMPFYSRTRK